MIRIISNNRYTVLVVVLVAISLIAVMITSKDSETKSGSTDFSVHLEKPKSSNPALNVNHFKELSTDTNKWVQAFPFKLTHTTNVFRITEEKLFLLNPNEYQKHNRLLFRDGFVNGFYKNETRFSAPFMQMSEVLMKEGVPIDAVGYAMVYNWLEEIAIGSSLTEEELDQPFKLPGQDPRFANATRTKRSRLNGLKKSLSKMFTDSNWWLNPATSNSGINTRSIADRLLNEVDLSLVLKNKGFSSVDDSLINPVGPGDPYRIN